LFFELPSDQLWGLSFVLIQM